MDGPSSRPFVNVGTGLSVSAIVMGGYHTCVLLQPGGRVKCWGWNIYGQLGYANVDFRGRDSNDALGDTLPFVDLGSGVTVTTLVAGAYHTCALLSPGNRVKCWGWNNYGQLGLNGTSDRGRAVGSMGDNLPFVELGTGLQVTALVATAYSTCALLQPDGRVKCWGSNQYAPSGMSWSSGGSPNSMGDNLPFLNMGI